MRLPRYSTVRGRLRADGRWIVTPRRGQPVVKQIALRRAHALFAAIQRALARPKAAATAARRVARGVTYVRLRGLEPRRRRLRLSPRQRPAVFRLAKGRLERLLRVK